MEKFIILGDRGGIIVANVMVRPPTIKPLLDELAIAVVEENFVKKEFIVIDTKNYIKQLKGRE